MRTNSTSKDFMMYEHRNQNIFFQVELVHILIAFFQRKQHSAKWAV
jgi:hypothetical protein